MKKKFLVLVTLMAAILLMPKNVFAGSVSIIVNEGDHKCETSTRGKYKYTVCDVYLKNNSADTFNGGVLKLTFEPAATSTTFKFEEDSAVNKNADASKDNLVVLDVSKLEGNKEVRLGKVTWTADATLTDEDCGGNIVPSWDEAKPIESGGGDDVSGEEPAPTETGYPIPYIALAVGGAGVVTFLATSKKKNKMYKI